MGIDRFNLNEARSFVGRNVNLHLKDGSVIVNVLVADAKREEDSGKPSVYCTARYGRPPLRIRLREIEWMEKVTPCITISARIS
ncbi:MAG: hypothetical protein JSV64_00400 [Candidatus Bathyarchaeota archaeon]|nr:MAG: hypothetical protein JSV64_00400 [Candidatus Bathyarchaeota archaeon]